MFDEAELRRLSPHDRVRLRRALAALDKQDMAMTRVGERRRRLVLGAIVICCVGLAAWTGLLADTLPRYYRAGGWRGAWVGFDVALLAAFAVTGWAIWRRRQIVIVCLIVLATLLCCDAWFDVTLDARTSGFWLSLLTALVVELPLAALAVLTARRLLRSTNTLMRRFQGDAGPPLRLRHTPLVGAVGRPFGDLLLEPEMAADEQHAARELDAGQGRVA